MSKGITQIQNNGGQKSPWEKVEAALRRHFHEPDTEAARAMYSAIAAHQLAVAARDAGGGRRGLPADTRRVRRLHAGAGFGKSGDGRIAGSESGACDSGCGVQLRFH